MSGFTAIRVAHPRFLRGRDSRPACWLACNSGVSSAARSAPALSMGHSPAGIPEADLSTTLRSGRDDRVWVERPEQQIPYGDDKQKGNDRRLVQTLTRDAWP